MLQKHLHFLLIMHVDTYSWNKTSESDGPITEVWNEEAENLWATVKLTCNGSGKVQNH